MKYKLSWRTPDLLLLEKLGFQDQHGEANYMLSYIPHMETMNTNRSRLQIWTVLNPTFPALQSPATPKMSNTFPKILSGLLLSLLLPERSRSSLLSHAGLFSRTPPLDWVLIEGNCRRWDLQVARFFFSVWNLQNGQVWPRKTRQCFPYVFLAVL